MAENRHMSYSTIIIQLVLLFIFSTFANEITTSINKKSLSVGEIIHFRVSINAPKGAECITPEPEQVFGTISVKEWNLSRKNNDQSDSIYIDYNLTTYIPENCTIPSIPYIIQTQSSSDTLFTDSISLQIVSVITGPDSTIDIKDLKPQQIAGSAPKWWLWISSIITGIVLLVFVLLFVMKKLKKEPLPPPPIPPYEEAIHALGVLHGKRLIEKGLIREYVFELSEIFKRYIERRFSINASEFTSEEMITWSGASGLDKKLKSSIGWFFRTTDPVKFARIIPDTSTFERFSNEVTTFLEATKPLQHSPQTESTTSNTTSVTQDSSKSTFPNTPGKVDNNNEVQ